MNEMNVMKEFKEIWDDRPTAVFSDLNERQGRIIEAYNFGSDYVNDLLQKYVNVYNAILEYAAGDDLNAYANSSWILADIADILEEGER